MQETVDARPLGDHVEVHLAQTARDGEAHRFGDQPAGDQHHQREREARQEVRHLREEYAQRLEHHFDLVHAPSSKASRPCTGMCIQSGRFAAS